MDAKVYHLFTSTSKPPLTPLDGDREAILPAIHISQGLAREDVGNTTPVLPRLTQMEKMLAMPEVKGEALEDKSWHRFNIRDLAPISWKHEVFDNLVLDAEEKKLLLALVSRRSPSEDSFDDFVQGKRQGAPVIFPIIRSTSRANADHNLLCKQGKE